VDRVSLPEPSQRTTPPAAVFPFAPDAPKCHVSWVSRRSFRR
jgi:hypothetical protein